VDVENVDEAILLVQTFGGITPLLPRHCTEIKVEELKVESKERDMIRIVDREAIF
jgi:hypothetical protein